MNDIMSKKISAVPLISIVLIAVIFAGASGKEISLSARLDKTEMPFEATAEVILEIKWVGGMGDYLFEALPLPSARGLKIQGTTSSISSFSENGVDYTVRLFKYTLKPTMAGTGVIEPFVLKYAAMPDSIPGELTSQSFQIAIAQPLPPKKKSNWAFFILLGCGLIILAGSSLYIYKRAKKNRIPKETVKSPEEIFLDELAVLKKDAQIDRKLFFTHLYKSLLTFAENKYGVVVRGRSTSDILAELPTKEIALEMSERLSEWLTLADKEKYAPSGGAPGDVIRLISELEKYFSGK
jgi:hypothetical protein